MHFGRDPLAILDTRSSFDALLLTALVDTAEELRGRHLEELAEALGGKG
jgi:hypothetical protein